MMVMTRMMTMMLMMMMMMETNLTRQNDVVSDADINYVFWSYHKLRGRVDRQVIPRSILGGKMVLKFHFLQFSHCEKTFPV